MSFHSFNKFNQLLNFHEKDMLMKDDVGFTHQAKCNFVMLEDNFVILDDVNVMIWNVRCCSISNRILKYSLQADNFDEFKIKIFSSKK